MTSNSLRDRIREHLEESLKCTTLKGMKGMKLLPIVGNGLTRAIKGAPSWDGWIRDAFRKIKEPAERFESLRRQGFEHPEILHFIFQKAEEKAKTHPGLEVAIWDDFGKNLRRLKPTNLHKALVAMADRHIVTTNYDVLLERAAAAAGIRRYHPDYVLEPLGDGKSDLPSPYPPTKDELVIWKLHGSLPPPTLSGIQALATFRKWLSDKRYKKLVATSASYRSAALTTSLAHLNHLLTAFDSGDNLCLFLGTSLTSAELVILRLLYSRWGDRENLFILNIGDPADRQIRFAELGIQTLNLPKGLAGNPARRSLAVTVLLEILLDRIALPLPRKKIEKFLSAAYSELPTNPLTKTRMADTVPIVACVGPLQATRVIGLSGPAEQEASHSPASGTLNPKSTRMEPLISNASMGQAGNPLLVWDAMDLPAAVLAEIGDDDLGSDILNRLQNMEFIDFDGVLQVLPQGAPSEASPGYATESFTCVTWFGARTIFDSRRFEKSSRCTPGKWQPEFKKIKNAPILYLTKTWSREFTRSFDRYPPTRKPLIVFETGTSGDASMEHWVAQKQGVLIASAKTALRWVKESQKVSGDEFGRYVQIARLLRKLAIKHQEVVKGPLSQARAIVVTLGELGALWWYRQANHWSGPFWTFPNSLEQHGRGKRAFAKNGSTLRLAEIRDALGCGDCARAGFVVSLARSLQFTSPRKDLRRRDLTLAVSSLCWFGIQKVRYFGMEQYVKFLRDNAAHFWNLWRASASSLKSASGLAPQVRLGPTSFEAFQTRMALSHSGLHSLLQKWEDRFDPGEKGRPLDGNREWIRKMADQWRKARKLKRIT